MYIIYAMLCVVAKAAMSHEVTLNYNPFDPLPNEVWFKTCQKLKYK